MRTERREIVRPTMPRRSPQGGRLDALPMGPDLISKRQNTYEFADKFNHAIMKLSGVDMKGTGRK